MKDVMTVETGKDTGRKDNYHPLYGRRHIGVYEVVSFVFFLVMFIVSILPLWNVLIQSIANYPAVSAQKVYLWPTVFDISSYEMLLESPLFFNSFLVSASVTVLGTVLSMIVSTMGAYALSRKDVPGSRAMFIFILIPMYFSGGLIPFFLTVQDLKLIDKYGILVLNGLVSSYYLILLKSFFDNFPKEIEDACKIDGASDTHIFLRFVLPLSAPAIATISLFYAVGKWNDYFTAQLFITKDSLKPMQLILRESLMNYEQLLGSKIASIRMQNERMPYTPATKMAMIVISSVPIFLVYPFLQKYFTKGIMLGAVKQ